MPPATRGPTIRPKLAIPCAKPNVSPCTSCGLASESSADVVGVTAPLPALNIPSATNMNARLGRVCKLDVECEHEKRRINRRPMGEIATFTATPKTENGSPSRGSSPDRQRPLVD